MTETNEKSENYIFHKNTFDNTTKDRRQKVLEVAIEEFATKGYSATSINVISKKANISIGSMYSYFASKEDLFLTIVNNAYYVMEKILADVEEESCDVFDCIKRMLVASRTFADEYSLLNQIYLDLTTQALSQMSVRLSNKLEMITPNLLGKMINQGKEQGIVRNEIDEKVIAYTIDNILMMYQFSFSSDYYKERMKIYIGEEKSDNMELVEDRIMDFIKTALEIKN